MESPTPWLHGFILRHDFDIIRDSLYKSYSRDYFYICRQQINVRKCSTNANCVFNWWQYAGRVWSHANSAQPPNSHLVPKLKIYTTHWDNSRFSFSWVSAVPRQHWLCLAIQFRYVMDRWNQQYFVPQLNIRPETINTDQIHPNAI